MDTTMKESTEPQSCLVTQEGTQEGAQKLMNRLWQICANQAAAGEAGYRAPLLAAAPVTDHRVERLRAAHPELVDPAACLAEARSIIAVFLPFRQELVQANRRADYPTESWARGYVTTNSLLATIASEMVEALAEAGIAAVTAMPTYDFDKEGLTAAWSHKHMAWACGLGEFGRHQMLITPAGTAGRFTSLVIDEIVTDRPGIWRPETGRFDPPAPQLCREAAGCRACERACPTGALSTTPFDRHACYAFLLEVDQAYPDLPLSDVCGFCACAGPCAVICD
ncbi:epoxyqueuosine reductase [Heliobacterium gestii]|uniref:Epoxyqueuosine reductase n=1 Tax=Heliomicrobium gestii TaxID=2699 RepID=A0A845LDA7_HELGE|nr:epoxyqueuosine reductase [Heliomicrobium gestii]MBM7865270.1 epoxyqueuosine reductase QueG [Heliomicrobium gestii]MZP41533.1 epoxyqueuosine reductase [Heliomicrobium gestii]